jgi:hypothetical protein
MMGEEAMPLATASPVETVLRQQLARENRALGAVVPVLRYLLASEGERLLSDAIVARVRGMLADLAAQLQALDEGRDPALRTMREDNAGARDALAEALAGDRDLLTLCHALAAESQLAERLHQQRAIDPVLSPLLQELIASDVPPIAELAMNALAAQSRFIQSQRRMELALTELPAELFHGLVAARRHTPALDAVRQAYDEAASRLGLFARLASAMRRGAVAALTLDHAGVALFASALATLAAQPRGDPVIACHEQQAVRLALMLRAAGQSGEAIERSLLLIDPAARSMRDVADLVPERARLLLAADGL